MDKKMMRVLSPVVGKDASKTHWMRAGVAYENRDGSINIYLDLLPTNGKLQLREFDEADRRSESGARAGGSGSGSFSFGNVGGTAEAAGNAEVPF